MCICTLAMPCQLERLAPCCAPPTGALLLAAPGAVAPIETPDIGGYTFVHAGFDASTQPATQTTTALPCHTLDDLTEHHHPLRNGFIPHKAPGADQCAMAFGDSLNASVEKDAGASAHMETQANGAE